MIKTLSRFAIRFGLLPLAAGLLRLYFFFIRVQAEGEEDLKDRLRRGERAIAAIWHQRILVCLGYARRFGEFKPSVMISRSRDGELIAAIYRRLHFRPVRGSSSRGGREALTMLIADLAEHPFAVHVVDGPQGPRGVVKGGLVSLAQLSGAPIVPVSISVNRAWVLKSWDRFLIPKPFSTVLVRWGEPIRVPATLDGDAFEATRRAVEGRLREAQERDDRAMGWKGSLF